jgi:ketosteroid isomerase-like protein
MAPRDAAAEQQAFEEALAALSRGDVDGFVERVAEEPDWKAVEELEPFGDREAVRRYTAGWLDHWTDFALEAEQFRPVGDDWLIAVHARGRSRDGVDIDDRYYLHVSIRDGLIARWHEYNGEDEALAALDSRAGGA